MLQSQNENAFGGAVEAFKRGLEEAKLGEPFLVPEFEEACKVAKEAAYTAFLDGFVYDETNKQANPNPSPQP